MKSMSRLLAEIRVAGLIYDPYITATILSYEAGYIVRNMFYASLVGDGKDEQDLRAGHLANARVELGDLITQARILAELHGWDWSGLVDTGEAKIEERIADYKKRGVRPADALMRKFQSSMSAPLDSGYRPAPRYEYRRSGD